MNNRLCCFVVLSFVLGACSCKHGTSKPPCEGESPLPGCGETCSSMVTCQDGLHCEGTTCTAECTVSGDQCAREEMCTADGQCVPRSITGDSGPDSNMLSDSGSDGTSCNDLNVVAAPVKPYIVFIVDRSGSMKDLFPYNGTVNCGNLMGNPACLSRWQSTRDVLLGAASGPLAGTGVIEAIDEFAFIGMVQYTGLGSNGTPPTFDPGPWPLLKETPAAVSNLASLRTSFLPFAGTQAISTEPPNDGDTPTGESVLATLCHLRPPYTTAGDNACAQLATFQSNLLAPTLPASPLPAANQISDPANPLLPNAPGGAPVIFVLATDGEPDSSHAPDGMADLARETSMLAVRAAREQASNDLGISIPTYVVSLALDSAHLRELACEGDTAAVPTSGRPAAAQRCMNPDPPSSGSVISASDASILRTQLTNVIKTSIPCSFQLAGAVNDPALARSTGTVTINGAPVTLDMNNGWWLLDDARTFTLNGTACTTFRENLGSSLNASFPCDSGVVIVD